MDFLVIFCYCSRALHMKNSAFSKGKFHILPNPHFQEKSTKSRKNHPKTFPKSSQNLSEIDETSKQIDKKKCHDDLRSPENAETCDNMRKNRKMVPTRTGTNPTTVSAYLSQEGAKPSHRRTVTINVVHHLIRWGGGFLRIVTIRGSARGSNL